MLTRAATSGTVPREPPPPLLRRSTMLTFNTLRTAAVLTALGLAASALAQSPAERPLTPPSAPERQAPAVERNLKVFDVLDFDVFSNQKWDRLHESHAKDIVVTWPDGHETKGIDRHIEDLKALFVFAPDITIKVHPIRFGSGAWPAGTGVMTGTFTRPMPAGDGKTIAPTGKSEEHTSELQSPCNLVCRLLLEKKKQSLLLPLAIPMMER